MTFTAPILAVSRSSSFRKESLALCRDGDIEPAQVGILFNNFHKVIDVGNLEIHIFRIDAFGSNFSLK